MFQCHYKLFTLKLRLCGMRQIWLKGCRKWVKIYCIPFDQRHSVGKTWTILNQGDKMYDPDQDFSRNSSMTLTVELNFSVQDYCTMSIQRHSVWSMNPFCPMRKKISQNISDKWSRKDRRTDIQITIERQLNGTLIKKKKNHQGKTVLILAALFLYICKTATYFSIWT